MEAWREYEDDLKWNRISWRSFDPEGNYGPSCSEVHLSTFLDENQDMMKLLTSLKQEYEAARMRDSADRARSK